MPIDPISASFLIALNIIDAYSSYLKRSVHMTEEEALADLKKVQDSLAIESDQWDIMIKEIKDAATST